MIINKINAVVRVSNNEKCHTPIVAQLGYDEDRPLEVEFTIDGGGGDVVWRFGRDLLREGSVSETPHGEGDVKLRMEDAGRLILCLTTNEGHADIQLQRVEVIRFLNRTIQAVRPGAEDLTTQIDDLIEEIYSA